MASTDPNAGGPPPEEQPRARFDFRFEDLADALSWTPQVLGPAQSFAAHWGLLEPSVARAFWARLDEIAKRPLSNPRHPTLRNFFVATWTYAGTSWRLTYTIAGATVLFVAIDKGPEKIV